MFLTYYEIISVNSEQFLIIVIFTIFGMFEMKIKEMLKMNFFC